MAALSISHLCPNKQNPVQDFNTRSYSRVVITVSCQNRDPNDPFVAKRKKEKKEEKRLILQQIFAGVEKLEKELKDSWSPKQKGDWKDILLMSLSFAVYVYMSQKIVCAYCVWMSMVGQPW